MQDSQKQIAALQAKLSATKEELKVATQTIKLLEKESILKEEEIKTLEMFIGSIAGSLTKLINCLNDPRHNIYNWVMFTLTSIHYRLGLSGNIPESKKTAHYIKETVGLYGNRI